MKQKVEPLGATGFLSTMEISYSKSFANRALILAAIFPEKVTLENIPLSRDVEILISCLKKIGLIIEINQNQVTIEGSFPDCEKEVDQILETGDGGTTNRFLIPLLALGKRTYTIRAEEGFRKRPVETLIETLRKLQVKVWHNSGGEWLKIQGPVVKSSKNIKVDCEKSTQFATGLAMALWKEGQRVIPLNLKTSKSYWLMTEHLLKEFDEGERSLTTPVDFSSLSYPLALAALKGKVQITNCLERDIFQADSIFLEILKNMGAKVNFVKNGLEVEHFNLTAIDHDCRDCPDLVPTLCFICSFAVGISKLTQISVLKHKESDRIGETFRILDLFGVKYRYDQGADILEIEGGSASDPGVIFYQAPADHRMIMVAYLFMRVFSGGTIENAQHVEKSFSNFFELMNR